MARIAVVRIFWAFLVFCWITVVTSCNEVGVRSA